MKNNCEELGYDVITGDIYAMLKSVGAEYNVDKPEKVFAGEKNTDIYDKHIDELCEWLFLYKKLNSKDRLTLSDVVITEADKHCAHGVMLVVNGLNGKTKVSSQSLKHVMDIISHLEDFYGARAWISRVSMHSDVFYYTISFVIWGENAENVNEYWDKNKKGYNENWFGNLKPLSHWR